MGQMGQRLAVDIVQQPQVQGLAIDRHAQQLFTAQGLDDLGHTHGLQGVEGRVLGLQLNRRIVAPADLQNKPAASAVDFVIEVLLAAQ